MAPSTPGGPHSAEVAGWRRLDVRSPWADRLLLVVLVFLMRWPGFAPSVVADWDEAMYILVAREILHGHLPYVAIFLEKPLGAPMMVALAMGVMGQSLTAVRILGSLVVAATGLVLRETAAAAGLSRFAAIMTALLYGQLSTQLGGLATNTEILFAPFTAAAFWVALAHRDETSFRGQARAIATAGALFGLAIWCKYIAAFPACALFGVLVGSWLWRRFIGLWAAAILAAIFAVACWLPVLLSAAFYVWRGEWDAFWYCNIGFMSVYMTVGRPFSEMLGDFIRFFWAAKLVIVLSGLALASWRNSPTFVVPALVWLLAEAVAVAAPWKFWDHYFLLLFPPLCLLSGYAVDEIVRRVVRPRWQAAAARLPTPGVVLAPIAATAVLMATAVVLGTGQWDTDRQDAPRQIASLIRSDQTPGASAWVVNSQPIIYFLAGIPIPTPYAFPPHLLNTYSILARIDPAAEVRRILDTHPRYLVDDPENDVWVLPRLRQQIRAAIDRDYRLVARLPSGHHQVEVYRLRE